MDIRKIFDAWVTAAKPNAKQKELAEKRMEICRTCPSKIESVKNKEWSYVCGECGCPLKGKIFTQMNDACPLGKWRGVEAPYFVRKNNPTII
jgi:hypothetical protein